MSHIQCEHCPDNGAVEARLLQLSLDIKHLIEIKNIEHGENKETLKEFKAILKHHNELLIGNGKIGLATQVDRLMQQAESHKWGLRTMLASTIGLAVKALWDIIT